MNIITSLLLLGTLVCCAGKFINYITTHYTTPVEVVIQNNEYNYEQIAQKIDTKLDKYQPLSQLSDMALKEIIYENSNSRNYIFLEYRTTILKNLEKCKNYADLVQKDIEKLDTQANKNGEITSTKNDLTSLMRDITHLAKILMILNKRIMLFQEYKQDGDKFIKQ